MLPISQMQLRKKKPTKTHAISHEFRYEHLLEKAFILYSLNALWNKGFPNFFCLIPVCKVKLYGWAKGMLNGLREWLRKSSAHYSDLSKYDIALGGRRQSKSCLVALLIWF